MFRILVANHLIIDRKKASDGNSGNLVKVDPSRATNPKQRNENCRLDFIESVHDRKKEKKSVSYRAPLASA